MIKVLLAIFVDIFKRRPFSRRREEHADQHSDHYRIAQHQSVALHTRVIRKKRLREEYSILWLSTGLATLIFSLAPMFFLTNFFSRITGLYYLSAAVLIIFLFLLLIVLHFSVVISKLTDRNKELAHGTPCWNLSSAN